MESEILNMQIRIIRQFGERNNKTPEECAKIFKVNGIWEYIRNCYDMLHLSSDECVLSDIMQILHLRGGKV